MSFHRYDIFGFCSRIALSMNIRITRYAFIYGTRSFRKHYGFLPQPWHTNKKKTSKHRFALMLLMVLNILGPIHCGESLISNVNCIFFLVNIHIDENKQPRCNYRIQMPLSFSINMRCGKRNYHPLSAAEESRRICWAAYSRAFCGRSITRLTAG